RHIGFGNGNILDDDFLSPRRLCVDIAAGAFGVRSEDQIYRVDVLGNLASRHTVSSAVIGASRTAAYEHFFATLGRANVNFVVQLDRAVAELPVDPQGTVTFPPESCMDARFYPCAHRLICREQRRRFRRLDEIEGIRYGHV